MWGIRKDVLEKQKKMHTRTLLHEHNVMSNNNNHGIRDNCPDDLICVLSFVICWVNDTEVEGRT